MWIDTHCHLDAAEFDVDRDAVVRRARDAGVSRMVLPAVQAADFQRVRELAHVFDAAYALGIHPLESGFPFEFRCFAKANGTDLSALDQQPACPARLVRCEKTGVMDQKALLGAGHADFTSTAWPVRSDS